MYKIDIIWLLEIACVFGCVSWAQTSFSGIIDMGGSKMTKYEKISLAISLALLIFSLLSYFKM